MWIADLKILKGFAMRFLLSILMLLATINAYAKPQVTFPKAIYYPLNGEDQMTELVFSYGLRVQKAKKLKLEQSYVILETPSSLQQSLAAFPNKRERRVWRSFVEKQTANWIPQNGPVVAEADSIISNPSVDRVYMYFTTQLILDIAEARRLIVEIAEGMLGELNADDTYTRCFHQGADFNASNLTIWIDFETYFGKYIDPLRIGTIMLEGGVTHFWAWNGKKFYGDCWEYRNEPYYKSLQYVLIERQTEAADYFQLLGNVPAGAGPNPVLASAANAPVALSARSEMPLQYVPNATAPKPYTSIPNRVGYTNYAQKEDTQGAVQTNYGTVPVPAKTSVVGTNYNPPPMISSPASAPALTTGFARETSSLAPIAPAAAYSGGHPSQPTVQTSNLAGPVAGGCNIPSLSASYMMPQMELPYDHTVQHPAYSNNNGGMNYQASPYPMNNGGMGGCYVSPCPMNNGGMGCYASQGYGGPCRPQPDGFCAPPDGVSYPINCGMIGAQPIPSDCPQLQINNGAMGYYVPQGYGGPVANWPQPDGYCPTRDGVSYPINYGMIGAESIPGDCPQFQAPIIAFDIPPERMMPPREGAYQPPEYYEKPYASSPNVLPPPGTVGYGEVGHTYPGFIGNYPNPTWPWTQVIPYLDQNVSDGWIWMNPNPNPPPSPMTPTEAPQMTPSYMYR